MDAYENIRKSRYELPPSPPKGDIYKPVKQIGNLLYTSDQGVTKDGQPTVSGRLGSERIIEGGQEAIRICTLNALSMFHEYPGDLNKIKDVVRILTFVTSVPGPNSQSAAVDGASQLLRDIPGDDNGVGARSATSAIELPGSISIEVEFIFEI